MRKTMTTYPEEFKAKIIAQMLPPHNRHIPDLACETGIPQDTLYNWRIKQQRRTEAVVAKPTAGPDRLSSQDKFHLVVESAAFNEQELGEFCRRRSVFPEQLAAWREACTGANELRLGREDSADNRKLARRNAELESELRRMEKALAEAAALLMLQKKVRELWAEPEGGSLASGTGGR
jgi:transposase-like protein